MAAEEVIDTDPSAEYLTAFNNGYRLQESNPDLAYQLIGGAKADHDLFQGFIAGCRQREAEMDKDLLPDWMNRQPEPGVDDPTPEKEDIESELG